MLADIFTAFTLGFLTPLTAVCVLPLYPAFLAYLSNQFSGKEDKKVYVLAGLVTALGVILSMAIVGVVFTTILQKSLTNVIGILSPIAFVVLALISLLLIFNINVGDYLPKVKAPLTKSPLKSAFLFGLFFGAIVLPCNPLFIAALFTRAVSITGFLENMINFVSFGFGMAAPLLVIAAVSTAASQKIIGLLTNYKRQINLVTGLIMLGISIYYLFFVFLGG